MKTHSVLMGLGLAGMTMLMWSTGRTQTVAAEFAAADWFERPVAQGVTWRFYQFENLFSSRQSISILEIDLDQAGLEIKFPNRPSGQSLQKTSAMIPAQVPTAVAGVNGTYFNTTTPFGGNTFLRVNSTTVDPETRAAGNWGIQGGMGVNSLADVTFIMSRPSGGWETNATQTNLMVCGPNLITADVIPDFTAIGSHCTSRHPRTAIGVTADDRLFLVTTDGRTDEAAGTTCDETAQIMDALGCTDVINLDGGGSTTMWVAGEPYSGVVNYPSDNSAYDHLGERSCANAIAVIAPAVTAPLARDGRVTSLVYAKSMQELNTQTVTVAVQNLGSDTWTPADTALQTARPHLRTSPFQHTSWLSATEPAIMTPASVAPGQTATFTFTIQAPDVTTLTSYREAFALYSGTTRFGPADSEIRLHIDVSQPMTGVTELMMEARSPGENYQWWSGTGWSTSTTNCTAPGLAGNIGQYYSSTRRGVVGVRTGIYTPNIPTTGDYEVYVAWGAGGLRQPDITYTVVHAGGSTDFTVDQSAIANVWVKLGTTFTFNAGEGASKIQVSNKDTVDPNLSGNMFSGGVKLVLIPPAFVDEWALLE